MYIYRCTTQNYADDVRYYVQVISDFCDIYCRRTSEAVVDEVGAANACFRPYMVCLVPCCTLLLTTSVLQVEHMVRFVSVPIIIKWPSTFVIGMVIYCTRYRWYCIYIKVRVRVIPSVLWRCWLGGRKGIRPVKKQSGGVLVWLSVWSKVQTFIWPSWCHCTHCLLLQ